VRSADIRPRTSDIRIGWLIAGLVLGVAWIVLAGPVGRLSDWFAFTFGVKAYWRAIRVAEVCALAAGVPLLVWFLYRARDRLDVIFPQLVGLAWATLAFNVWLMTSAVEPIHYPQYALLGYVLRLGAGRDLPAALIGFFFGALDEYAQGFSDRRTDLADVEFNFIGVLWGLWSFHLLRPARAETALDYYPRNTCSGGKNSGQGIRHETTRNGTKASHEFQSGGGSRFAFFVKFRGWFGCGHCPRVRRAVSHIHLPFVSKP